MSVWRRVSSNTHDSWPLPTAMMRLLSESQARSRTSPESALTSSLSGCSSCVVSQIRTAPVASERIKV